MPNFAATYSTVFRQEMSTIVGVTRIAIEEMHMLICDGKGGPEDQERYHAPIFERYFKDSVRTWPEYDGWKRLFFGFGKWPMGWPLWDRNYDLDHDWAQIGFRRYDILMRTILLRARSLHEKSCQEDRGTRKVSIAFSAPEDTWIVELVLKRTPNAYPPLFPYDLSRWRA